MNKAIFNINNGIVELLCSKCGKLIKKVSDFDVITKFAYEGSIIMLARYCDEHNKYNL